MEEWIAKRINSPNVLKAVELGRQQKFLYLATEYIDGQTLEQWMVDHPTPEPKRLSPPGDGAPGPSAKEHHD